MSQILENAKTKAYLAFAFSVCAKLGEERTWRIVSDSLESVAAKFDLQDPARTHDFNPTFGHVLDWLRASMRGVNALSKHLPRKLPAEHHEILAALALFADALGLVEWAQYFALHSAAAQGVHLATESTHRAFEEYITQGMSLMHARSKAGRSRAAAARQRAEREQKRVLEEAFKLLESGHSDHELAGILARRHGMPTRRTIDRYLKPLRELREGKAES